MKKTKTINVPGAPVETGIQERLAANIEQLEKEIAEKEAAWHAPIPCANPDCGRDTRKVNPCFAVNDRVRDSLKYKVAKNAMWCSQACRATATGEHVSTVVPMAQENSPKAEAPTPAKGKAPAPPKEKAEPSTPKRSAPMRTGGSAPWSNLAGKLHLTGKKPPNFQGNRKQVWDLIKEGLTVGELYEKCNSAGLDGKSNLAKIIGVYGCAEVK